MRKERGEAGSRREERKAGSGERLGQEKRGETGSGKTKGEKLGHGRR